MIIIDYAGTPQLKVATDLAIELLGKYASGYNFETNLVKR